LIERTNSASELIRKHIHNLFDKGYDYTSKYNRKIDKASIIESLALDEKRGKDLYNHQFKKVLKQRKLNTKDYLETRFLRPRNLDMNVTIKPKPQSVAFEKSAVDVVNEEVQQQQVLQQVGGQSQIKNENIDPGAVESTFKGLWTLLKLKWPLEDLTKEEIQALGRMWLPIFKRYFSENWAYIGLPFIAAIGIFGKHIIEARRIKKENELKVIEEEKEVSE